jgi:L-arabinose isomerase
VGDLADFMNSVTDKEVDELVQVYSDEYAAAPGMLKDEKTPQAVHAVRDAAKIELGMRRFLEDGGFSGFTTTFEDLHGLAQLPGLAVQRLMHDGYGFGAEGDWKTSALLHAMKAMGRGLPGGTSFMEDYTYHLHPSGMLVLGAHMLEVCPSIAADKPSLEVHPLSIGGKADPARLVFSAPPGPAVNVALMDMGKRFRLTANAVEVVEPGEELPKLPVARAVWRPHPDLKTSAAAWILSGAAHHSVFTQALTMEHLEDFAGMTGIELVEITEQTTVRQIKNELRWNEASYS